MNVFRYEVWQYRRALLGWSVGLAAFLFVYLPFMPAFLEQSDTLKTFLQGLGPQVGAALGLNVELFFGPLGFYGFLFTFFTLAGAIQAAALGLAVISKENRMKTADFLMTKPKSRTGLYLQKLLAVVVCLAVTGLVFYTAAAIGMHAVADKGTLPIKEFVLVSFTFSLAQLFFMAMGMFVAVVVPKIKSTITVAVGMAVGFFLLGMVANLTGSDLLRVFAPLRYFDTNYILTNGAYETKYLVLDVCVAAVLLAAGYVVYVKRDVKAA